MSEQLQQLEQQPSAPDCAAMANAIVAITVPREPGSNLCAAAKLKENQNRNQAAGTLMEEKSAAELASMVQKVIGQKADEFVLAA